MLSLVLALALPQADRPTDVLEILPAIVAPAKGSWLAPGVKVFARAYRGPGPTDLTLSNGFSQMTVNLASGQQGSQGAQITVNGRTFNLGGADKDSMNLVSAQVITTYTLFDYRALSGWPQRQWPPGGSTLTLTYSYPSLPRVGFELIHEVYDGAATQAKWIRIRNNSSGPVLLNSYDLLRQPTPQQHQSWDGPVGEGPMKVGFVIPPGASLTTYRQVLTEIPAGREADALGKMRDALAPWHRENPLCFVIRSSEQGQIEAAIEQAAEVGLDLVFLGPEYWDSQPTPDDTRRYLTLAQRKGIRLGITRLAPAPKEGETNESGKLCWGSEQGVAWLAEIRRHLSISGLGGFLTDAKIEADNCRDTTHPGHQGGNDATWRQAQALSSLFRFARSRGLFVVAGGEDFLNGQSRQVGKGWQTTSQQGIPLAEDKQSTDAFVASLKGQNPVVKEGVWIFRSPAERDVVKKAIAQHRAAFPSR